MPLITTSLSATTLVSSRRNGTTPDIEKSGKRPGTQSHKSFTIPLTILSVLLFIVTSLIFTLSILALTRLSAQLTDLHFVALHLNSFIYFSLALSSFVGVYFFFPFPQGKERCRVERGSLLSIYASLLVLSLGTSILCIYLLFRQNPSVLLSDAQAATSTLNRATSIVLEQGLAVCAPESLAEVHDVILVNFCRRSKLLKVLSIALIVAGWLVNLGEVILINMYSHHVQDEIEEGFKTDPYFDDTLSWHYKSCP